MALDAMALDAMSASIATPAEGRLSLPAVSVTWRRMASAGVTAVISGDFQTKIGLCIATAEAEAAFTEMMFWRVNNANSISLMKINSRFDDLSTLHFHYKPVGSMAEDSFRRHYQFIIIAK